MAKNRKLRISIHDRDTCHGVVKDITVARVLIDRAAFPIIMVELERGFEEIMKSPELIRLLKDDKEYKRLYEPDKEMVDINTLREDIEKEGNPDDAT